MKNFDYLDAVMSWTMWLVGSFVAAFVVFSAIFTPHLLAGMLLGAAIVFVPPFVWIKLRG